jgi:5'-3' exonuclease
MLIDSRNAVYRAIYAGLADQNFMASQADFSVVFFRFISSYIQKYRPSHVHFFWDAPKSEIWRKGIMKDYKEGRDTSLAGRYTAEDIERILTRTTQICMELAPFLGCRNYEQRRQEADDLIFAFCRLKHDRTIIISSDGDFKQIAYLFAHVDVYNPLNKDKGELYKVDHSEPDPVEIKSLTGEVSDNIRGYRGIGPVKARVLATDSVRRVEFFKVHGEEIYLRNRALIDLSLCPFLLHNIAHIHEKLAQKVVFDLPKLREIIQKYKVKGLMGEVNRVLLPFKFMGDREVRNDDSLRGTSAP